MKKHPFLQPLGGFWNPEATRNTHCLSNFCFDCQAINIWPYMFRLPRLYFPSNSSFFCQNGKSKWLLFLLELLFCSKKLQKNYYSPDSYHNANWGLIPFAKTQTKHWQTRADHQMDACAFAEKKDINKWPDQGIMTCCRCLPHVGSIKTSRSSIFQIVIDLKNVGPPNVKTGSGIAHVTGTYLQSAAQWDKCYKTLQTFTLEWLPRCRGRNSLYILWKGKN